jgi:hypothetical protein
MLRISGAIQVLEEELAKTEEAPPQTHAPDDSPGSAVKIIAQ